MDLPQLKDFDFKGKKVLVRCDLDVPIKGDQIKDDSRIKECLPTIKYLLEQGASVILMGHLGRPEGKVVGEFSLAPVAEKLSKLLGVELGKLGRLGKLGGFEISESVFLLENLRFDKREEENDRGFAKELASLGDFYVNEAFASSHREHASIVGIPKLLPHCPGFHFAKEVENLSKVLENPKRPLVVIIGGAKPETKLPLVEELAKRADWVLVGGTLPRDQKQNLNLKTVLFAGLTDDGFDIDGESIKKFCDIIKSAGAVVWNGPMGKYEEQEGQEGTRRIAEAIANSTAFKMVGGGDTIAALTKFGLIDKMDYVSTGGGAMLEFLAKGTLPGIETLISK